MPPTVLIVDDHEGFRGFARRLLEASGFTVVGEADDGASAVAAAEALRPELVLLDVVLPDTDGFAVAERLAESGNGAVVVLTSSREAADFGARLERSRAQGFIHKDDLRARRSRASPGRPSEPPAARRARRRQRRGHGQLPRRSCCFAHDFQPYGGPDEISAGSSWTGSGSRRGWSPGSDVRGTGSGC